MTARRIDPFDILFYTLTALSLLPIWAVPYFPSQDGPSHLYNADIIREYPWHEVPLFGEFYLRHTFPFPNWTGHVILAVLSSILPLLLAEKIFLSAYVIGFALAFRYCIRSLNPAASATTLLAFPFMYNYPFQMGFYNFSTGLVMYFVTVGYWLRHYESLSGRRLALLALFSTILYFSHMVALTLACMTIGLHWVWFLYVDWRKSRHGHNGTRLVPAALSQAVRTAIAFLPGILLALWFLHFQGAGGQGAPLSALDRLRDLFVSGYGHSTREVHYLLPWKLTLIALVAILAYLRLDGRHDGPGKQDAPLLLVAVLLIIYLMTPDTISGGGAVAPRIALYFWIATCIWLGVQAWTRLTRAVIATAGTLLSIALIVTYTRQYATLDSYLKEYVSVAAHIAPNSTLLALELDRRAFKYAKPADPFQHAAGYLAAQRQLVDLTNYEAGTGYFPVSFIPAVNPYVAIGDTENRPFQLDLLHYGEHAGHPVDYVLLWGRRNTRLEKQPDIQSVLRQLRSGYDLVYTSAERGYARLYRRKEGNLS